MNEAANNTEILRSRITEICDAKNVHQGKGPPFAYFRGIPDVFGESEIYKYVIFATDGLKKEGESIRGTQEFEDGMQSSTAAFDVWLQPNRTLVWREEPECVKSPDDGLWRVYWRCVQLYRPVSRMAIEWNFL